MLANHAGSNSGGYVRFNSFPGFAVVRSNKNISAVVVGAMAIQCQVSRAFRVTRRDNAADVSILRNAGNVSGDVFPGATAVARDLQIAVIRSGVQQTFLDWRFSKRNNLAK